jgi:dihydrolipoamide dehydrogenase
MDSTDLLVIGAGPGGYVAAIRAGQLDLDVTLVDKDALGGTCLNTGCIPSKALITATDVAHEARTAEEMGIHADVDVDLAQMTDWKDGVVDQLTTGVERLCKANGVTLLEGRAEFVDEHCARIETEDGEDPIDFENAIIATGSRPLELPGFSFGDDPILGSRDVLALDEIPDELLVVGGGYIGMELSTMLSKLGASVTVVEMLDSILPQYEDDIVRPVKSRAEELGISFNFGEAATDWTERGDGIVVTTETEAGKESRYEVDAALVAVGRQPVTDTLGLDAVGLAPSEAGFLETDARARTDLEHVFAVGDVAGEPMLAHQASAEGLVAAEVAAGGDARLDSLATPAVVFTDPEIGSVGLTEDETTAAGHDPLVGEFPFYASGRALTTGDSEGFVRVVADEDGTVLGARVVGSEASELIAELTLATQQGLSLDAVAETIHAHPTLSEATMEAAENALGKAIHTLNR